MSEPKVGDKVTLVLEGIVIQEGGKGHGECFEVEMPQRDYIYPRRVWVDLDEIDLVIKQQQYEEKL